ncbi:hypothetical protein [Rhodopirellula bahusiensis]|uniref:hypothetical protein n=1 Tax=Rhodopirellula bahusiensis TaxID=2014065 RepID=UPI003D6573A4
MGIHNYHSAYNKLPGYRTGTTDGATWPPGYSDNCNLYNLNPQPFGWNLTVP